MTDDSAKVIDFHKGEKVDLGNGSYSNLILTDVTLENRNKCMMGYSVFKPGINTKQKIHVDSDEYAYILSGSGKLTIEDRKVPYKPGDSLFIPAGLPHGVLNDGKEDVVMLFFFTTPNYPRSVDAVSIH